MWTVKQVEAIVNILCIVSVTLDLRSYRLAVSLEPHPVTIATIETPIHSSSDIRLSLSFPRMELSLHAAAIMIVCRDPKPME
jgi:hypothetical protein